MCQNHFFIKYFVVQSIILVQPMIFVFIVSYSISKSKLKFSCHVHAESTKISIHQIFFKSVSILSVAIFVSLTSKSCISILLLCCFLSFSNSSFLLQVTPMVYHLVAMSFANCSQIPELPPMIITFFIIIGLTTKPPPFFVISIYSMF